MRELRAGGSCSCMTPKRPRTMPTPRDEVAIRDGSRPWNAVEKLCTELDDERSVQDELAAALQALLDISPFSVQPGDVDIHRAVDAALARWQGAKESNESK